MFKQRLIATLILIPLVLCLLFYAPLKILALVVLIIYCIASTEFWNLVPFESYLVKGIYFLLLLVALWLCTFVFSYWLGVGLLFWGLGIIAVVTFPSSQILWGYRIVVAFLGLMFLPLFAQSLIHLYVLPQGRVLFLYLLCLIWAADIGAYLIGKLCGKNRLIPQVSPGKSWEGVLGGCSLSMLIALGGYIYFMPVSAIFWFVLAGLTVIISIFGDLFFSMLKRRCHIKDTGSIIPGHGGILDRFDCLISALPFFYFGLGFY